MEENEAKVRDTSEAAEAERRFIDEVSEAIVKYRARTTISRQQLSTKTGVATQTITRYELVKGKKFDFETVMRLISVMETEEKSRLLHNIKVLNDQELAAMNGMQNCDVFTVPLYDSSPEHIRRLEDNYAGVKLNVYYFNTVRNETELTQMKLTLGNIKKSGYIDGSAIVKDKYEYKCKLISPIGSLYTYIFLTANNNIQEHAVIVFPFNRVHVGKYIGGIGVMLSLSLEYEVPLPCFEKTALVAERITISDEEKQEIGCKYLLMDTESINRNHHDTRKVYGDNLAKESFNFFEWVRSKGEK